MLVLFFYRYRSTHRNAGASVYNPTKGGKVMQDVQAGDICLINGTDAYDAYKADLASIQAGTGKVNSSYLFGGGNLVGYGEDLEERVLQLQFYVFGEDAKEREQNTSNLVVACRECTVEILSRYEGEMQTSDLRYQAILTGAQSLPYEIEAYNLVTLIFAAVQTGRERKIALPASRVMAEGNSQSPCCVTLRPTSALSTFSILGIEVKNLKSGDTFVIDGIQKRVTRNGHNALQDTDLVSFPTLSPGWNNLAMSASVPGEIRYFPIYR